MKIITSNEEKNLSRRDLLIGAGKLAAGVTVLSASGLIVSEADARKKPKYPWAYKKLNPDKVAEIAYNNWYKGFCCYAVASGILIPLQKMVGEPYASFPIEAVKWGHGGVVGWGTMCGSLLGAGFATSFAAGHKNGEAILNDVIAWYAETNLPIFEPAKPKASIKNKSISHSPLCHVSVNSWMKKEGVKFFSPQRKDRCARLSADVAVKTVKLLNAWADGKYVPVHGSQVKTHKTTTQNNCGDCHK